MVGKVSAVVLGGLLLAAVAVAPDALARRGGGPGGGSGGYGGCRQQTSCGCEQDGARDRKRLRDDCRRDPSQCPNREDCPGPGAGAGPKGGGPQDGTQKGAGNR